MEKGLRINGRSMTRKFEERWLKGVDKPKLKTGGVYLANSVTIEDWERLCEELNEPYRIEFRVPASLDEVRKGLIEEYFKNNNNPGAVRNQL